MTRIVTFPLSAFDGNDLIPGEYVVRVHDDATIDTLADGTYRPFVLDRPSPEVTDESSPFEWEIEVGNQSATIVSFPTAPTTPAWNIAATNGGARINDYPGEPA
jgi:hypothetical protein